MINEIYRHTRRFVVTIIGFTILLIGILLIVLPGPAIIVIPIALAILATEFVWAKTLLNRVKKEVNNGKKLIQNNGLLKKKEKKQQSKKKK